MLTLLLGLLIMYSYSLECSSLPTQNITFEFCSDLDDWVVGNLYPNGAFAVPASNDYRKNKAPYGLRIWESAFPYDLPMTCYIGKSFNIPGTPISAILSVQGDDKCTVRMNDQDTGCKTTSYEELKNCDLTLHMKIGINTLNITVVSIGGASYLNYYLRVITSVRVVDIV